MEGVMKTRECRECHKAWVSINGHHKHAYRALTLRGYRAFRCPGVPAIEWTPSIKQQTLDEVRRIRELLEVQVKR
jgi:hypothetical protein